MISFEEALRIILEHAHPLGTVRRKLEALPGMALSEPVQAGFDLPRFSNSSVDGFGVRFADVATASGKSPVSLRLIGEIQAGDSGRMTLNAGEAVKIMTGAPVPKGVESVIMREDCKEQAGTVRILTDTFQGENIRPKGGEFQKGQTILTAGTIITPPVIGLLATLGLTSARAFRKPKVGIIITGNELVQPGKTLKPGQIYDANRYAMQAALQAAGIETINAYHVPDDLAATQKAFGKALRENDVLISLGGISVGDYDFVKTVVEALGIQTLFWRISMKPGKPVYFGTQGKKLVFGLPGNPVSALVTYHQLVLPALRKIMGHPIHQPMRLQAQLSKALHKSPGRQEFVRGKLQYANSDTNNFTVVPSTGQDSHMLGGLAEANCLIDFPQTSSKLLEGQWVPLHPIQWHPD